MNSSFQNFLNSPTLKCIYLYLYIKIWLTNKEERNLYFNKWSQENLLAIEKEKDPAAILEDNSGE